jgi:apolipoprotein N-acyltransferase
MNPIQFFNDGDKGTEFSVFDTRLGVIGILICYDMDYSYVARGLVRSGAEMLVIPTYDALSWSALQHEQHSAMASMRAVENGRYLTRAASSGISMIIDPHGRRSDEIGIGDSAVSVGQVQALDSMTFYSRAGYLFPWFCAVAVLSMLLCGFVGKKIK